MVLFHSQSTCYAFNHVKTSYTYNFSSASKNTGTSITATASPSTQEILAPQISIECYEHKNFKNLTYLYKKPAPGRENAKPIILIHPVGIGLSSWFWKKVMNEYHDNPAIYAPDLIGCGIDHGADSWKPDECGLFFPLSWVEGVETLLETVVMPRWRETLADGKKSFSTLFFRSSGTDVDPGGCLVVAQGGLAPVGIMLAKRNPCQVHALMLTSPPTYEDITTPIPQSQLERNYNFLCSPIFGNLAFSFLENRSVIKFFSNIFLFAKNKPCDDRWLDETEKEACFPARAPVQAFNAGLLQHRSFEPELKEMTQTLWIVSGDGDRRALGRREYGSELKNCTLKFIEGLNVLPWENASGVIQLINDLGY
ncbi:hypothetical protein ACHAXS_006039 [Conticribra weissflogii]